MTHATKEGDAQMQIVYNTDHERHSTVPELASDGALSPGVVVDETSLLSYLMSFIVIVVCFYEYSIGFH
jgi:hypothetical protein